MADPGDRKDPSLDKKHQAILIQMQQLPENRHCADCLGPAPRWASTNLGCFLCIACSGIHRKIGVHLSVVRSVTLDTWTPNQVARFRTLGNSASAAIYEAHMEPSVRRPASSDAAAMERFIRDKYERLVWAPKDIGGLAGEASQGSSRFAAPRPSVGSGGTLGQRPAQRDSRPRHGYDDQASTNSLHSGRRRTNAQPFRSNGIGAARFAAPRSDRADALKSLADMGFEVDVAYRALEASNGNLQRAVEWILQNEPRAHAPPQPTAAQGPKGPVKPQSEPPQEDLLSFDDAPEKRAAPDAKQKSTAPPAWASDDDFADFGAFSTALPNCDSPTSGTGPASADEPSGTPEKSEGKPAISLASLYAQGPSTRGSPSRTTAAAAPPVPEVPAPRSSTPSSTGGTSLSSLSSLYAQARAAPVARPPQPSGARSHVAGVGAPAMGVSPATPAKPPPSPASAVGIGLPKSVSPPKNNLGQGVGVSGITLSRNSAGGSELLAVPPGSQHKAPALQVGSNASQSGSASGAKSIGAPEPASSRFSGSAAPEESTAHEPPNLDFPLPSSSSQPPASEGGAESTSTTGDLSHADTSRSEAAPNGVKDEQKDEDPFASLASFALSSSLKPSRKTGPNGTKEQPSETDSQGSGPSAILPDLAAPSATPVAPEKPGAAAPQGISLEDLLG